MLNKIKTQEELQKEKRRNQIIIGVILIGIMIVSTAGYAILSNTKNDGGGEKISYKGFNFVRQQGYWMTEANGRAFIFQFLPEEIENISISGVFNLKDYSGKTLYLVNNNPASVVILQNLGQSLERYQEACMEGINCTGKDLPVKTCKDNLIIFLVEEDKGIYKQDNCVFITGNVNKGADAFVYKLAGII